MDMQLIRSNFGVRSGLRSQIGLGFTWTVDSRGLAQSRIGSGRAGAVHERRANMALFDSVGVPKISVTSNI